MSKKKIALGAIIIFVLVLTVPNMVVKSFSNDQASKTKIVDTPIDDSVAVKTELVSDEDIFKSVYSIGEVKPTEEYKVNAKTEGKVTNVFFEVGDYVKAGEILFELEADDFIVDKDAKLKQSSNSVTQSEIALKSAKDNYDSYVKLFESGAVSQKDLDNAKVQYDNANISYTNANKSYESLKYSMQTKGDDYKVSSPVSGVISQENIAIGMNVSMQNGYTIEVVDSYKISTQVSSKKINMIKPGQEVNVYVSTLDKNFKGTVSTVSQSGVNGLYPIEVQLNQNDYETLKSGMYVDIWIIVDDSIEGVWIPSNALIELDGKSFVYIIEDGKSKKVNVEVLYKSGDRIAVKGDILKTDKVITYGKEYIIDGSKIFENK